jgi:hypothetical protein
MLYHHTIVAEGQPRTIVPKNTGLRSAEMMYGLDISSLLNTNREETRPIQSGYYEPMSAA